MRKKHPVASIADHLHSSYVAIILLLSIPAMLLMLFLFPMTSRYHQHISAIADARDIIEVADQELQSELWEVVAGQKTFAASRQQELMDSIGRKLTLLLHSSDHYESRQYIQAATRLNDTLATYVEQFGHPVHNHSALYSNEQMLREVRSVTGLMRSVLQEFIYVEIGVIAETNGQIRRATIAITALAAVLLLLLLRYAILSCRAVQQSIQQPIETLETMSVQLASGNLEARAAPPSVSELTTLTHSLNAMADQLGELIEHRVADQRSLQKAEMRTLQAQITPHFIYNTLDTIVWLAQQQEHEAVVEMTMALTQFFRISLSRGRDYITVAEEVAHVRSYLQIQSVRYESIMRYEIDVDPSLLDCRILKLLLQPLVENAIYHGLKNKRGRGQITVRGVRSPGGTMTFSVADTGAGMPPERLRAVRAALAPGSGGHEGFGLYNISQRLRLYYSTGLTIQSEAGQGTIISFTLPCRREE